MSEVAARAMPEPHFSPTFIDEAPERRKSARVPVSGPIRVGPPHREPHARLSATDLSTGGLFIDADRPVRVGARFCAEIVLSDGRHLYIPEAEVAYNRDRPHGAGFGVRFVNVSEETRRLLEEEVARLGSEPMAEDGVDIEIDPPEPTVSVPPLATDAPTASEAPAETAPVGLEGPGRAPRRTRRRSDPWGRIRHEARAMAAQLPSLWLVLAGMGAALLVAAVGLVVWAEVSEAPRVVTTPLEPAPAPVGLTSETHQQLMGADVEETLPPLAPLTPPPALKAAEGARPDARQADGEPGPERAAASTAPAPAAAKPAADRAPRRLPPGAAPIGRVGLPEGARVLRTSRLKNPARFVIDVRGLDREPESMDYDRSRIERIRFGRHEGFGRLVLDLTGSTGRLAHRLGGRDLRIIELD
jgi:hypothetical protein